jgi:hypothetical protein
MILMKNDTQKASKSFEKLRQASNIPTNLREALKSFDRRPSTWKTLQKLSESFEWERLRSKDVENVGRLQEPSKASETITENRGVLLDQSGDSEDLEVHQKRQEKWRLSAG